MRVSRMDCSGAVVLRWVAPTLVAVACLGCGSSAQSVLDAADESLDAGDVSRAITLYSQAIEFDPRLAEAYAKRGTLYLRRGDLKRAAADLNRASELNPSARETLRQRGLMHLQLGDFERAIADFDAVLQSSANDLGAKAGRGRARVEVGQYQPAIDDLDAVLRATADDTEARIARGKAHYQLGHHDRAIADFSRAIQMAAHPYALWCRAKAYEAQGAAALASADRARAIELDPSFNLANDSIGRAFTENAPYAPDLQSGPTALDARVDHK